MGYPDTDITEAVCGHLHFIGCGGVEILKGKRGRAPILGNHRGICPRQMGLHTFHHITSHIGRVSP